MPYAERFNHERSDLNLITRVKGTKRIRRDLVLLELVGEKSTRKRARVHGHSWQLGEDVRQRANMVFMSVRDEDRLDRALSLAQVGDVRNDDVYAERGLVRKCETAVDEDDRLLVLVEIEVFSDLPHSTERNESEWWPAWGRAVRTLSLRRALTRWPCRRSWSSLRLPLRSPLRSPLWACRRTLPRCSGATLSHSASLSKRRSCARSAVGSCCNSLASPAPPRAEDHRTRAAGSSRTSAPISRSSVGRSAPLWRAAAG